MDPQDGLTLEATGGSARTGWPAVAGCFCLALFAWSFGFYGQAVFLAGLQREFGFSSALVSAATTVYYLLGALCLAAVPDVIARLGIRPAVLVGMACLAGGASLLPYARAVPALFGLQLVMAIGWALTSGTAVSTILAPWFGRRRGLAISLALNGASAAGFTTVPLMIRAIEAYGFATALESAALLLFVLAAPITLLTLRPPGAAWLAEEGRPAAGLTSGPDRPRFAPGTRAEALRTARFWWIAMPFGLGLFAQVGFVVHQVAFLLPRLGPDSTGTAVALTTIAALVGRIGLGAVVDRLDRRGVTAAGFGLQLLAFAAMLAVPSPPVLYGASFVFGLWVGNAITLPALLVLDEFAPAAFALVIGLVTALNQLVYAFGPAVLGILHDASGGYGVPLAVCVLLDGIAVAAVLAGRPRAA